MPALADQVQVHRAQRGLVPVRVVADDLRSHAVWPARPGAGGVGHGHPVVEDLAGGRGGVGGQHGGEHAAVHVLQGESAPVWQQDVDRGRERP